MQVYAANSSSKNRACLPGNMLLLGYADAKVYKPVIFELDSKHIMHNLTPQEQSSANIAVKLTLL